MIPDGRYVAVIDRFEGDRAVVLLETEEEETVGELLVPREHLPEPARHADAVLQVTVSDGEFRAASYDEAETERRKRDAQARFDRLARRPPHESDEPSE